MASPRPSRDERHESVDPSRRLYDVTADRQGVAGPEGRVKRAYEFGALATAAQLVGAAEALLDAAVDYAKQRTQFGRPIGSYQAIKHKLADVHIAIELARPLVYGAALIVWSRATSAPRKRQHPMRPCWRRGRRYRRMARSDSPRNMTCRCGCCACRRCARRGVMPRHIGAECWSRYEERRS